MSGILTFFAAWFLLSIPSSLIIGAWLGRRNAQPALAKAETRPYRSALETSEMPAL